MIDPTPEWAGVAVDIGNSKADVAILSADGSQVRWMRGGSWTPQRLGWTGCATAIVGAVERLTGGSPVTLRAGYVAVAGVDFPEEEARLAAALHDVLPLDRSVVVNDAYALLASGGGLDGGVCVVAGTGMNCVGVRDDHHVRFSSLGALTGDWGGGRDVALAGLAAACREQDGRGGPTLLTGLITTRFGVSQPLDVSHRVHEGRLDELELLPIAEDVFAAARAGDPAAASIIDRQAAEVAAFINAAHRRLGTRLGDLPVVLGGSLLRHGGPLIHDAIRRHLNAPGLALIVPSWTPLVGALSGVAALLNLSISLEAIADRMGSVPA